MAEALIGVGLVILASIIEGVSQTFFKKSALVAVRASASFILRDARTLWTLSALRQRDRF